MKQIGYTFCIMLIVLASCKKPGCIDSTAENFNEKAKTDDGTCTYQRDAFLGTYVAGDESCDGFTDEYTLSILEGPSTNQVIINNLYDFGAKIIGTVANHKVTFSEAVEGIHYSGTAFMLGNEITINFELCETIYYPCSEPEACSFSGIK